MKKGLETYNNFQVAAIRIFFSFILLLPYSIKNIPKITSQSIRPLLIVAFLNFGLPALLFTTAQTKINSSLAAILNSTTPFFTLLIGLSFYSIKFRHWNIYGVIFGFAGALALIITNNESVFAGINWYAALILIATLFYGITVNEVKTHLHAFSGIQITSLAIMFVGPLAGLYLLFSDYSAVVHDKEKWENLLYIFILASLGTVMAQIIFNNLIKYTTTVLAASVTYIIPVFAIFWGIIDGEKLMPAHLLWIALILFGVYLVNKK